MVGKTYNLPTSCPCIRKFDFQHRMNCKKGHFIYIRHNDLQHLTANMMSEMCKDTEIEPKLTLLSGDIKQFEWGKGRYKDSRFLGTRVIGIFRLQGFRPQPLSLWQQVPVAVPFCECAWKEISLQWKNPSNRPSYIYTPSVFNQGWYGKTVQNVLLVLWTNDIWNERPFAIDFKDSNKSLLWVAKIKSALFKGVENSIQKNSETWTLHWCISLCDQNIN